MAKRRRRRSGKLNSAARAAKNAPKACKVELSACMRGPASRAKRSKCMKQFHRCAVD